MSGSQVVCCHLALAGWTCWTSPRASKTISARGGTGNVSKGCFHPCGTEVEPGVLFCPGGAEARSPLPSPDWGCGLSTREASSCLHGGMGSVLPSPTGWSEKAAMQMLSGDKARE